ncbi:helix-turn-helix domain-containing protein [Streptomyces noursei]
MVNAAGSIRRAARLTGCSDSTLRRRLQKEEKAQKELAGVAAQVQMIGSVKEAAEAGGISPGTVYKWRKQEQEGRPFSKRQQSRMARLQRAAAKTQQDKAGPAKKDPVVAKLRKAVLGDAQARQRAIKPLRAARISQTGARFQSSGQVSVISTDGKKDTRERRLDLEMSGGAMRGGMQQWLAGGSSKSVLEKLSDGFTENYLAMETHADAAGARWEFDSFKSLTISRNTADAPKWGDA